MFPVKNVFKLILFFCFRSVAVIHQTVQAVENSCIPNYFMKYGISGLH